MSCEKIFTFLDLPLTEHHHGFSFFQLEPLAFLPLEKLEDVYEEKYCTLGHYDKDSQEKFLQDLHEAYGLLKNTKKRLQHLLALKGYWPPSLCQEEDFLDFLFSLSQGKEKISPETYLKKLDKALEEKNKEEIYRCYWILASIEEK